MSGREASRRISCIREEMIRSFFMLLGMDTVPPWLQALADSGALLPIGCWSSCCCWR